MSLSHLDRFDFRKSVYSASLIDVERRIEVALGVFQNDTQQRDNYSFIKGVTSLVLKMVFCPLAALCAVIEGVVRIILAVFVWLGSCFFEGGYEVARNLFEGAVMTDRTNTELTALTVVLFGLTVPFSDFFGLIYKIGERLFGGRR